MRIRIGTWQTFGARKFRRPKLAVRSPLELHSVAPVECYHSQNNRFDCTLEAAVEELIWTRLIHSAAPVEHINTYSPAPDLWQFPVD